jgi:type II secretory pathway pseudopilin PulG
MRTSKRSSRAFSIVESMIAIVVLAIGVVAMLGILPQTFSITNKDSQHVQALSAGQAYMDQIRYYIKGTAPTGSPAGYPVSVLPTPQPVAVDFGDSVLGTGQSASGSVNFTFVPSCVAVGASALEFNCTVTVSWNTGNMNHSLQIESYVTTQT